MAEASQDKPDLTNGIPEGDLADGAMLVGRVGDEAVLVARRGREIFAIGATCTHYGGPLGEGLMVEDTVRCPLASRLLQPAHRRGPDRTSAERHLLLENRAA